MTNIEKYIEHYDMSSHDAKKVSDLLKHLRHGYSVEIKDRAKEKDVILHDSTVRNIRNGQVKNHFIFGLLIELAQEDKEEAIQRKANLQKSIEAIS